MEEKVAKKTRTKPKPKGLGVEEGKQLTNEEINRILARQREQAKQQ